MPIGVYVRTGDTKDKVGKSVRNLWLNPIYRQRMVNSHVGIKLSEKHKKNIANSIRGRHFVMSEKGKKNIALAQKGTHRSRNFHTLSESHKSNISKSMKGRMPSNFDLFRAALRIKPNNIERKLDKILNDLFPNQYKYNDGWFLLGGKVPDFVNVDGRKQLIELFGDYWHASESEGKRIEFFKQFGYDCLIIWQHELKNENNLREKLLKCL